MVKVLLNTCLPTKVTKKSVRPLSMDEMELEICAVVFLTFLTTSYRVNSLPLPDEKEAEKVNATSRILFHAGNGGLNNEDQEVVFPDSEEDTFGEMSLSSPPVCAGRGTFCEDYEAYPYHHLQGVLRRELNPKVFFGDEDVSDELTNRIGEAEENFICKALQKTIYPRVGKNKHNEWKVIINQKDKDGYIQGIRVEICSRENRACDIIGDIPHGYKTTCKQKYFYRKLYALSDDGLVTVDSFQLPSACCCSYKRDYDFLRRFGTDTVMSMFDL